MCVCGGEEMNIWTVNQEEPGEGGMWLKSLGGEGLQTVQVRKSSEGSRCSQPYNYLKEGEGSPVPRSPTVYGTTL